MLKLLSMFALFLMTYCAWITPSHAQFVTVVGAPGMIADFQQIHNHNRMVLRKTESIDQTQSDIQKMFETNPGTNARMYAPAARRDMIDSMPLAADVNTQAFFGRQPANRTDAGGRVYFQLDGAFQNGGGIGVPGLGAQDAEARKTLEELAGISNVVQMANDNLGDLDDREKLGTNAIEMVNRASNITEATIYNGRLAAENMIVATQIAQAVNLQTIALSQLGIREINEAAVQREERRATARLFAAP